MERGRRGPSGQRVSLRILLAAVLTVLVPLSIVQDFDSYTSTRDLPAVLDTEVSGRWVGAELSSEPDDTEPEPARRRRVVRRVALLRNRAARSSLRWGRRWHASFLAHPPV